MFRVSCLATTLDSLSLECENAYNTNYKQDFRSSKIALESYFEEHVQEVWERNWMNPEMQTTLLNTHPPKLIATILKALREQLKENDQLNAVEEIAGPS